VLSSEYHLDLNMHLPPFPTQKPQSSRLENSISALAQRNHAPP
jgi:hypothetical protein